MRLVRFSYFANHLIGLRETEVGIAGELEGFVFFWVISHEENALSASAGHFDRFFDNPTAPLAECRITKTLILD